MHRINGRTAALALPVAVALWVGALATPANAEAVPVTGAITGEGVLKNGTPTPLPEGTSFAGTFDDETGAFSGDVTYPLSSTDLSETQTTALSPLEGTVNLDDNTVTATLSVSLNVETIFLPAPYATDPCLFTPIEYSFEGTYDPETMTISMSDTNFTVPPVEEITANCGGFAAGPQGFNEKLAGSEGNSAAYDITLVAGEGPTTSTTVGGSGTAPSGDSNGELAETGQSSHLPLLAGVAFACVLVGGIVTARRRAVPSQK